MTTSPPVLGFVAASGTGKTTLLTQLITLLCQRGLRVGVLKHSHHDFEIDKAGKDSFKLRHAGAVTTLLSSPYRRAIITEKKPIAEPCLQAELAYLQVDNLDLILVEGFKHEAFAKIELHRHELSQPLLYPHDRHIIAVATNYPLPLPAPLIALNLNEPPSIAHFITHHFMNSYARPL